MQVLESLEDVVARLFNISIGYVLTWLQKLWHSLRYSGADCELNWYNRLQEAIRQMDNVSLSLEPLDESLLREGCSAIVKVSFEGLLSTNINRFSIDASISVSNQKRLQLCEQSKQELAKSVLCKLELYDVMKNELSVSNYPILTIPGSLVLKKLESPEKVEMCTTFPVGFHGKHTVKFDVTLQDMKKEVRSYRLEHDIHVYPAPQIYLSQLNSNEYLSLLICNFDIHTCFVESFELKNYTSAMAVADKINIKPAFANLKNRTKLEPVSIQSYILSVDTSYFADYFNTNTASFPYDLKCFLSWGIDGEMCTLKSLYSLPQLDFRLVKLIVSAKVLTPAPYVVNKPLEVRYTIQNKVGDFKRLNLTWSGDSSLFCFNPDENLGAMSCNSELECNLKLLPTKCGVFELCANSIRVNLQLSAQVNEAISTSDVLKRSLCIEVTAS